MPCVPCVEFFYVILTLLQTMKPWGPPLQKLLTKTI